MINLLEETKKELGWAGQSCEDIIFIGSLKSGHSCTWEEFTALADEEYHNGYGTSEVALDLVILFKDGGRLYREEYDGSEWWIYQPPVDIPQDTKKIETLFCYRLEDF